MKNFIYHLTLFVLLTVFQSLCAQQNQERPKILISDETKSIVVDSYIEKLKEIYIFPEVALASENKIREFQKTEAYKKADDVDAFAKIMTQNLRLIINDKHIGIRYAPESNAKKQSKTDEKIENENLRIALSKRNFAFPKVEVLRGNVGYLKVDGFTSVDFAAKTASAAMEYLSNTDAMIIDLRENHGGDPAMVQFLASYFFDKKPVHLNDLYYRKGNKTEEFWTLKKIPGTRYINKPVYILISNETFSGGEEFANDLKELKRGILLGENTGGGANPGDMVDLKAGFTAFIPNGRAINPITKTNWEGIGVAPDIKTDPKNALNEAHVLALSKLLETTTEEMGKLFYKHNLDFVKKQMLEK